jgi:BMFP domain-containing protein YqiC
MTTEEMVEPVKPQPRFALGLRGYDRAQVDTYVADSGRWAAQAWDRIIHLETRMSELEAGDAPRLVREDVDRTVEKARRTIDRFVGEVDDKAAELQGAVVEGARPRIDQLRHDVEELEDQRRSTLDELSQLRQSLNGLVSDVYGIGVPGDDGQPDTVAGPSAPEALSPEGGEPLDAGEAPHGGEARDGAEAEGEAARPEPRAQYPPP